MSDVDFERDERRHALIQAAHDQRNADMKVARRKWDAARKRADAALDRATPEADARWLAARDRALPATVLAPLSVTAEQVALITDPRYPDGRAFGPVFTDSVHEAFRRGVDTALAAMGIPVVES